MSPTRRAQLVLLVSCLAFATTTSARAAPPVRLRVEYHAPASCPPASAFSSQIVARTSKARIAAAGELGSRLLRVTITREGGAFTGRLELADTSRRLSHRVVSGDGCAQVVAALALVTALTLDPLASTGPLPPRKASKSPPPSRPSPPRRAPPPATARRVADAATPAPGKPAAREAWGLAAGVALRGGVLPDVALTLPVSVELEAPGLGASLRAIFQRSLQGTVHVGSSAAVFRWTAGAVEACPISWSRSAVRLSPCFRVEAGVLEGQGQRITGARSDRQTWVALGAMARAEWSFLPPAFADLGAGVLAPLIRKQFIFYPHIPLYRPPAVGWAARLGLGLRFP